MPTTVKSDTVEENRLISAKELQAMFGIQKNAMYRLMRRKKNPLPSLRIGKLRKFQLNKVVTWLEKQ